MSTLTHNTFPGNPETETGRALFGSSGFADPEPVTPVDTGSTEPVEDSMTPGSELDRIRTIAEPHLRRLFALAPDVWRAEVKPSFPVIRRADGSVEITEAWTACVVVGNALNPDCITAAAYAATVEEAVAGCAARYAELMGQRSQAAA